MDLLFVSHKSIDFPSSSELQIGFCPSPFSIRTETCSGKQRLLQKAVLLNRYASAIISIG